MTMSEPYGPETSEFIKAIGTIKRYSAPQLIAYIGYDRFIRLVKENRDRTSAVVDLDYWARDGKTLFFNVPLAIDMINKERLEIWDQDCAKRFNAKRQLEAPEKVMLRHWKECQELDNFVIIKKLVALRKWRSQNATM